MADLLKRLAADLEQVRRLHLEEALEEARYMEYDSLAVVVGSSIGGLDPRRMIGLMHYLLEGCRSQGEKLVLAALFATWPRRCAVQFLWRDTGRYVDPALPGFVDEAGESSEIHQRRRRHRARVHVHQRHEGPYKLGFAVELTTVAETGDFDNFRQEEVTVRCNIEVANADWERDVYLQNAGYLVRRLSDEEAQTNPVPSVTHILKVLTDELDRRVEVLEEQRKQKPRLVPS